MIGVLYGWKSCTSGELVLAALRRSVTFSNAEQVALWDLPQHNFLLAISPDEGQGQALLAWLANGPRKLILFGRLPHCLLQHFGMIPYSWPEPTETWARSPSAPSRNFAQSEALIHYLPKGEVLGARNWERPLERFDFTDEWNNLGFGAVRAEGTPWSLTAPLRAPERAELANVQLKDKILASYCALFDESESSILWVNREVGPIDSFEWRMVENFISSWRHEVLHCLPIISEIPFGYDAAITMRLDCDEDIASARALWAAYCEANVPLSLAIHTNNLPNDEHSAFLREFLAEGGALLSHTATHAPDWGGSYDAAHWEGIESRTKIEQACGVRVEYAVSPFHQSPDYALAALCDVGYRGCIGGIIRNDPAFLIARGGELAHLPKGFVGHSQQSMLHGDCMLTDGDPLAIFKRAFDRAYQTRTLYGYLDHPFSTRYQYGWPDEKTRVTAHQDFIAYIREHTEQPLFLDECRAMDFLRYRAAVQLRCEERGIVAYVPETGDDLKLAVEFRGSMYEISHGVELV
ncbi:polysaccharide deacetylase family protein [Lonsdalea quercina]|uniref:polysaccharide deacetylase n=1 Tax=Lonsdalea quercina TaxID=71657 RepID=UPI003975EFC2